MSCKCLLPLLLIVSLCQCSRTPTNSRRAPEPNISTTTLSRHGKSNTVKPGPKKPPPLVSKDRTVAAHNRPAEPKLLTIGQDMFVAAWRESPAPGISNVMIRLGRLGESKLRKPVRVNPMQGHTHRDIRLERIDDKHFLVAWWEYRILKSGKTQKTLFYREFDDTGLGGKLKRLALPPDTLAMPHLVRFPENRWLAVWSAKGKKGTRLYSRPLGDPASKRYVLDPSRHYHNFFHPKSVVLSSDRAMVIWWASVAKTGALRGRIVNRDGRPLSPPFFVTRQLASRVFNYSMTRLSDGGVVVTWDIHTRRRIRSEVMARVFASNGRGLAPAFFVNTYRRGHQVRPTVAPLANGQFAVVWQSQGQDGDGSGVYLQMFRKNGKKEGGETKVPLAIEGHQLAPRIGSWANNHMMVLWTTRIARRTALHMRILKPFRFPM